MKKAANIMAEFTKESIKPAQNRMSVEIKSWPIQTQGGILVPGSNVVVRNELYISKVVDSEMLGKDDLVITSMYSGYHVPTINGFIKIINESDILMYKYKLNMENDKSFEPSTFVPGTNYLLVRYKSKIEKKTKSGIIVDLGKKEELSKNDSVTQVVEVVKWGIIKDIQGVASFDKTLKRGDKVIIDKWVGIEMNQMESNPEYIYKIIYHFDILAKIEENEKENK